MTDRAGTILAEIGQQGFRLVGVTGPHTSFAWTDAVPLLRKYKHLWEPYETFEAIYESLMQGRAQLWMLYEGDEVILLMITKMDLLPSTAKVCTVQHIYGRGVLTEPKVSKLALEYVELYAFNGGCTSISGATIKRFAEHLEVLGFQTTRYVVEKTLTSEAVN